MTKEFLNSRIPLVHAVTEWLAAKVLTTPSGVPALDHMIVLVPTRQAGRRLRESLAAAFPTGCIPPKTMLPSQLLQPMNNDEQLVPSKSEFIAILCETLMNLDLKRFPALFPDKGLPSKQNFTWALGQAGQLQNIWRTLEEGALTMSDVAARIEALLEGEDLDVEVERWKDLAELEEELFSRIRKSRFIPPTLALRESVATPVVPDNYSELVLPALVDGVPALYKALQNLEERINITLLLHADNSLKDAFDTLGVPDPAYWLRAEGLQIDIPDELIEQHPDSASQAACSAEYFASIPETDELPALGMADRDLFRELHSAFLSHGMLIHNPAGFPLRNSSLARLIQQAVSFSTEAPFPVLAAFIRQHDVSRWLRQKINCGSHEYALTLETLDGLQNRHIPQNTGEALKFCRQEIAEISAKERPYPDELRRKEGLILLDQAVSLLLDLTGCKSGIPRFEHISEVLKELFSTRTLSDENRKDRELSAAARMTLEIIEDLGSPRTTRSLTAEQRDELFSNMLQSSNYQLEPPPGCIIQTEGWLELPWNPANELVITGFNEGCVPASLVGHPFLPDSLRRKLGLLHNDLKAARDAYILYSLVNSRERGAVRILLERANADGDVRKPSRLLFLCDDETFASRAARLFSEGGQSPRNTAKSLPESWRFNPPTPDEENYPRSLSVTRIGAYLKCPFTFYLSDVLKMGASDDRAVEMDAMTFGNLCHHAIENFSRSSLKDSTDPEAISQMLKEEVSRETTSIYGEHPPAVIILQMNAAQKRLQFFAELQARRTADGWKIKAVEERFSKDYNGVNVRGRVDRIDYNPKLNTIQVIDFKTWDKIGSVNGIKRYTSTSAIDLEFAQLRGFRPFNPDDKKPGVFTDMQLPLYMLMMPESFKENSDTIVECGYFVLGESRETTVCACRDFSDLRQNAIETMNKIIGDIKAGIYWPPSPRECWKRDYASFFLEGPQEMNAEWIAEQAKRVARVLNITGCKVEQGSDS